MKLRIRGNSIRLRLTKGEVKDLGESGKVEDEVAFGAGTRFRYELKIAADHEAARAKFEENCLSVSIPSGEAKTWIGSEQVGIVAKQAVAENELLSILVEKDFACLTDREGEDDTDAFSNPMLDSKC